MFWSRRDDFKHDVRVEMPVQHETTKLTTHHQDTLRTCRNNFYRLAQKTLRRSKKIQFRDTVRNLICKFTHRYGRDLAATVLDLNTFLSGGGSSPSLAVLTELIHSEQGLNRQETVDFIQKCSTKANLGLSAKMPTP